MYNSYNMANLLKKVIILSLLFLAVITVYIVKNEDAREGVLLRLGLASSKDFKIPEDIKIEEDDINLSSLAGNQEQNSEEDEDIEASLGEEYEDAEKTEYRGEAVVAVAQVEEITLEEMGVQIEEIGRQVEIIAKEVDILIAINEIQKEIKNLADRAEDFNLDCVECNILSSI